MSTQTGDGAEDHGGDVEYGQIVVLATGKTLSNVALQLYQWRTASGVVQGELEDWIGKMGIAKDGVTSIADMDPVLAGLNRLAKDGWRLVDFEEVDPSRWTYDRGRGERPFVTTRCWLMRGGAEASPSRKREAAKSKPKTKRGKVKR